MIKTTIAIITMTGMGVGATTAPVMEKYNPVMSIDMHVSYLDITAESKGVSVTVNDEADFAFNLKLRNGHVVKVKF